jgi:hypothetical protein
MARAPLTAVNVEDHSANNVTAPVIKRNMTADVLLSRAFCNQGFLDLLRCWLTDAGPIN